MLTDEKEQHLRDMGFVFNCRTNSVLSGLMGRTFQDRWDARFEQLLKFKETHGHACVERRYKADKTFSEWCLKQVRVCYSSYELGVCS